MLRQLRNFVCKVLAGANVATVLVMLAVGFSDRFSPESWPMVSGLGLFFPILLLINLAFLLFWLFFKLRYALIPVLGLLVCYVPVRKYCPLNPPHKTEDKGLKVLSFNVWNFGKEPETEDSPNKILHYLLKEDADILCLQEAVPIELTKKALENAMKPHYSYFAKVLMPGNDYVAVYSKLPIVKYEKIRFPSKGNVSGAFYLKTAEGDTVLVVNNHFETTGISRRDRTQFKDMVKGTLPSDTVREESRRLIDRIAESAVKRTPQAEAVLDYIRRHDRYPVIVCGDFNDGPLSYVHHLFEKELTDCYVAAGLGPGFTYHRYGFYVRIDHIFCSSHFRPVAAGTDHSVKTSDHYPVHCRLVRSENLKN